MTSSSRNFLLYGQSERLAEQVALRAGPLSVMFEMGDLRYVKLGGREVIRRIYAAVRDRNWGTVPGRISNLNSQVAQDSFRITYDSEHKQADIHFIWRGEIIGDANGAICFTFDGEAKTTFLRNRIGFCVLHPIRECARARGRADYIDGTSMELNFPDVIAAEQPVKGLHDLAGLAHEIEPGVWAELKFEGDAFEMEDQRNWIDASFKTFCTPLRLPYPVAIKAGARVQQTVRLRLAVSAPEPTPNPSQERSSAHSVVPLLGGVGGGSAGKFTDRVSTRRARGHSNATVSGVQILVAFDNKIVCRLPLLGLGTASHGHRLSAIELSRLAALKPGHLRVDVRPSDPASSVRLTEACADAKHLGAAIELAVHFDNSSESSAAWLRGLRAQLEMMGGRLARTLVFGAKRDKSTPASALTLARAELGSLGIPIGAGTNADLYQLNLERPPAGADFICWSMNPQVHAFDHASIAETPEAVAQQVASVREYFPGKPLVVSPITLKPRFNPVATGPEPIVPPGELPPQVDSRQMSLFGAAWTLAMLNALAEGGAHSVTFFETTGWRGVMETEVGSPAPDKFLSTAGQVFPVYHVFAALAGFVGGDVLACAASNPRELAILMVRKGDRARLCLGNLTGRELTVSLPTRARACRTLLRLNEHTAPTALVEPKAFWSEAGGVGHPTAVRELTLAPCELVFLDFAPSA